MHGETINTDAMPSGKKKVVISACLLGEFCRYDGKTKKVNRVIKNYKDYEIIPFCPEAPLFGTPREKINIVEINTKRRVVTERTNVDVTLKLEREIVSFCRQNPDIDAMVLKSKSPSCGNYTTPILNQNRDIVNFGDGVATAIFKKLYKNIEIKDEND